MGYSSAWIRIDQRNVRIVDSPDTYEDTIANTIAYSGAVLTALPSDVRRFEHKANGQEFWIKVNPDGESSQESPDASFVANVQTMVDNLAGLIAAKILATTPPFTTDSDPDVITQVGVGVPLTVIVTTGEPLPLDMTLRIDDLNSPAIEYVASIDESPDTIKLIFNTVGFYEVELNNQKILACEVSE